MRVTKYSGELVPFNVDSLKHSLVRSGADDDQVDQVYKDIDSHLYDGISTRELYELAFDSLKKQRNSFAARYSLKKALRDLGPEGFYFEDWIGRLFSEEGYQTVTGQVVQGHAVSHEIDVVAVKEGEGMLAIECKFRNDVDAKISVTTPMYFMSRVKDIKDKDFEFFGKKRQFTDGWLVTNAYLTSDTKDFGAYYKLNLLSWDYPSENSIKARVDHKGLYPITCLTNLSEIEKKELLKKRCILVLDLVKNPAFLDKLEIAEAKKKTILLEANELCSQCNFSTRKK